MLTVLSYIVLFDDQDMDPICFEAVPTMQQIGIALFGSEEDAAPYDLSDDKVELDQWYDDVAVFKVTETTTYKNA